MPLEPTFSIRVSHTGVFADGRANTESIFIHDLESGDGEQRFQNHQVPSYVPVAGSLELPLSARVFMSFSQGAIAGLFDAGLVDVEIVDPGLGTTGMSVCDGQSTKEFENGSWEYPWKTIQRGINAMHGDPDDMTPAGPTEAGEVRTMYIIPGTYDEDIVLPPAGAISLVAFGGGVSIGTVTSPRSVTRVVDPTLNPDAPLVPVLSLLTNSVQGGGIGVFGDITLSDIGAGQIQNFIWEAGLLLGDFDATSQSLALNMTLNRCLFVSTTWTAPTGILPARDTRWLAGTPSVDELGAVVTGCEFAAGFTVAGNSLDPVLTNCDISGTVTSPTDFRVDFTTNGYMADNGVALAGGWTTTIPVGRTTAYP